MRVRIHLYLVVAFCHFIPLTGTGTAAPGDVESGFNPIVNDFVLGTALQADEKILIWGNYTSVAGVPRNYIARLNPDGTLDTSFDPNADSQIHCTAVQIDGKILVGGAFSSVSNSTRKRIARLNPDGTIDASFTPPDLTGVVDSVTIQSDGKIIIAGAFSTTTGTVRRGIARLQTNGVIDTAFNPGMGAQECALQSDGKIVAGGFPSTINGTLTSVRRIHANGALDPSFNAVTIDGPVLSIAIQVDGKILIGGFFDKVGGESRYGIARLHADGALDQGFYPNPTGNPDDYFVIGALQTDGKIVVGGLFKAAGGEARNNIARLHPDGSLDAEFKVDSNERVHAVGVQTGGEIVIGGLFTSVSGVTRQRLARLENGPAIQSLSAAGGNRVSWLRSGASPEIEQVTFELSVDGGKVWNRLGSGARVPGGWELNGLNLPSSGKLRARGRATGGHINSGSSIVEAVAGFPAFDTDEFRILSVVRRGQDLLIEFPSITGMKYTLWESDSLASGWRNSGLPDIAGSGVNQIFTIPAPAVGTPKRFYRVQEAR